MPSSSHRQDRPDPERQVLPSDAKTRTGRTPRSPQGRQVLLPNDKTGRSVDPTRSTAWNQDLRHVTTSSPSCIRRSRPRSPDARTPKTDPRDRNLGTPRSSPRNAMTADNMARPPRMRQDL